MYYSSNTAITSFHLLHIGVKYCQVTNKRISNGEMGQQVLAGSLKDSPHSLQGNLLLVCWRVDGVLRVCSLVTLHIYLHYFFGTALSYFKNSRIAASVFLPIEAFIMQYMDEQFLIRNCVCMRISFFGFANSS